MSNLYQIDLIIVTNEFSKNLQFSIELVFIISNVDKKVCFARYFLIFFFQAPESKKFSSQFSLITIPYTFGSASSMLKFLTTQASIYVCNMLIFINYINHDYWIFNEKCFRFSFICCSTHALSGRQFYYVLVLFYSEKKLLLKKWNGS